MSLKCRGVALCNHVTHYVPGSDFPCYNLTRTIERAFPICHIGTRWTALWSESSEPSSLPNCRLNKNRQYTGKSKKTNRQTMVHKTLQRKQTKA